ncbi:hypothetical protein R1sor_025742 [Riccia sorocarpa]|uniref:non-specific serine/threonine protein kinase n=1 Tax=Riccia sorocarpa TaxID=122646 RepID=A0ABD3GBI4_9MARC
MGLCFSKAGAGQPQCEDDGFCTPELVSEQYESGNPSGRYSYGLDTPRISAEVGDLGVLGSLFYRRGSRGRARDYINPLEMFLGVTGRNRLQHVNRMCSGDFSMASYLSSPLLKGFDVHAMEEVAKSYAESAAKAAARDTFVFLEENDVCTTFTASPSKVLSAEEAGDADDDCPRSGESDWEDPLRKSEDWDARQSEDWGARMNKFDNGMGMSTSGRLDTILHTVQARAKAKRRQRRKSTASPKEVCAIEDTMKKTVRFQVPAESEEELTDDDLLSCIDSEGEVTLARDEADDDAEQEMNRAAFYGEANESEQHFDRLPDRRERTANISASGLPTLRLREEDEDEEEEVFHSFAFTSETIDCDELGGTTPLVAPAPSPSPSGRSAAATGTSSPAGSGSEESSADYYIPCSSLSSSSNRLDEFTTVSLNDNDDEATSCRTCGKYKDSRESGHLEARQQNDSRHLRHRSEDFSFGEARIAEVNAGDPQEFEFHPQSAASSQDPPPQPSKVHAPVSDLPTPIPVGCVVVESRLPDGSRDSPQILDLDELELPAMSGNHSGFLVNRVLHLGDSSSPAALESTTPATDQEGGFTFPRLHVPSSSYTESAPFRETRGLWKDPPITDLRSSCRPHASRFHPSPLYSPKTASSSNYVDLDHYSPSRFSISDEIEGPRCSFSFDVEPTSSKRSHEIVFPVHTTRSRPPSPSKFHSVMSRNLLPSPAQQSAAPYPPRSRRGMSKKLKFYSLERASYAAGAKRSRSPPTFVRKQRREDIEGDSSSDLFEIETLSGTNAMGSSRTPPPTPVKVITVSPSAAFDLNRLSSSIAQVSRSRSRRLASKDKPSREKSRACEKTRVSDYHQESSSILKGRAFLKLGLLRRSKFSSGKGHKSETDLYRGNETSGSEYLENKPPSPDSSSETPPLRPYMDDEKINSTVNLAFQWNCSVMEQLFGLVNNLLRAHPDTQKRNLGIRTYKVIPFTPSAGVLEWVNGTVPLGEYLLGSTRAGGAHGRYGGDDWTFMTCREHMSTAKDKLAAYQTVCEKFRPVMHHFFLEKFTQPEIWFERRLAYTRSVATSSMVGYIVGLGDRHSMNILMDQVTAEVVHIDLGVAFEQGLMLKTPERVPFRLTRDLVDGMGATGVEGVFRRVCEATLSVLRENKEALLTIIEVFIYDPLYNWALSPLKALQRQQELDEMEDSLPESDNMGEMEGNKDAARALFRVKQKLDGYEEGEMRSLQGQVQQLIHDAEDPERLSQLFPGWGAWV